MAYSFTLLMHWRRLMDRLQELLNLGGASMIAIGIVSIFAMMIILYKLGQFTFQNYWFKLNPSKQDILTAGNGLKGLEIATVIAPLLGLLGTVIGMITAFQTLESAGSAPEISLLAGGIWQALSTTAAGMVVAIIATVFLGLFDGAIERMAQKIELSE